MAKVRKKHSPQAKVKMVLEGLAYPDGIMAYCRKAGISDVLYYNWKKQLVDNASAVFEKKNKKSKLREEKLQSTIDKKDKIISELVEENIDLKKNNGLLL